MFDNKNEGISIYSSITGTFERIHDGLWAKSGKYWGILFEVNFNDICFKHIETDIHN